MPALVATCHARGRFETPSGMVDRLAPGDTFIASEEDARRLLSRGAATVAPKPKKSKKAKAKPTEEG